MPGPLHEASGVLLVANYEPDVGYAWWLMERFWTEVADICRTAGRKCFVAYPTAGPIPERVKAAGIEVVSANFRSRDPSQVRAQVRILRGKGIDTLYLTDWKFRDPVYALYRLAGVRRIINHDHTPGDRPRVGRLKGLAKALLNEMGSITCDHWICISPLMHDRARSNACIPERRCSVVQNGIDPLGRDETIRRTVRSELGLSEGCIAVVTVGRATPYKGIDFVIRVAAALREHTQDVRFFYIGDGPESGRLMELAEGLGLDRSAFTFLGRREDVRRILPAFEVALHAAAGEGFSLAILEYMSAGLATLVPDVPSVMQAVDHRRTGLIYAHGSLGSALQALEAVRNPQTRRRLGEAAAEEVVTKYAWERTRTEFRALMRDWLHR
jgi:glycosyltransferase involved in cell wall biosynthesis